MSQPGGSPQVLPDTELIISRRAFKNNSSKYYLDGKESNFTTVTTLLREKGVDLDHKRFLILQGEVESIAQMKPKAANEHDDGLLEYLEDIIGTSKYKTPIEESAAEVETLNEVCVEKSGRVQHVEKERNSLEDKKNKAVAYVNDENELAMKRSALWQIYVHELQANLGVTGEAIEKMQADLNAELEKHQGSEAFIKKLEKMYAKGSNILDAKDKETQALVKEAAKLDQERVKFDEKKKFLADKRKKLEKTIASASKSSAEADATIEECTEDIETRAGEIASLEEQIKEEEAQLAAIREGLKGKTQAFSDQIAAIAVAESELKNLEEKANAGAVALKDMEAKVVAIEDGKAAKKKEMAECEARRAELEQEAAEVESELKQLSEQEPRVRQKVSNARQKADEARSNLSASQTQGNVLTALMRMRESGRIDGFHGRLGNLGTIDEMYDVAISTACSALDNFVTDSVEGGQQCVEYLRKTNLGRGNFICLDKLRVRDMSPIQTPEKAPRLFDLVKPKDDRFRPAFYHALQDTLVAKDLAQANRIAYGAKRWRVVTLAGELIDKSGTMSGGGSTVKRGLMSSKLVADVTKEQVTKLETDLDALETKFQEFQEHLRHLETRLREIRDEIPRLDTRMQKIRLETEAATRNLADTHKRIKDIGKEHQPSAADDSRAAALKKEMAKLHKEVAKLHGETASVEAEIKSLQDRIMESGGEKLRTQRAKVDELKAKAASHGEETSKAEVRKAKAEKQKAKLEKDQAKAAKELDGAAAELARLDGEMETQGERAEQLAATVAEAEEQLGVMRTELNELKEELDEKTAELNATKAVEIEMRNKLEESQKAYADAQKQLRHREQKLSQLVLQNIDELTGVAGSSRKHKRAQPSVDSARKRSKIEGEEGADEDGEEEGKTQQKKEEGQDGDDDVEMGDVEMADAQVPAAQDDDQNTQEMPDVEDNDDDADNDNDNDASAIDQPFELPKYTPDELSGMSKDRLKTEIAALEERTSNASVDLNVLAEYRRRVEEHAARSSDLSAAVGQRDTAKRRCDDLRRLRLEGFMEGFSAISLRLKEMYQMITMGGNAELELVDSLDPFSEGILFSVMPPKKSWKNISNLSGGEKTLSSLALVFALHHYKPTPLYVMDEIDAALDFRNVSDSLFLSCLVVCCFFTCVFLGVTPPGPQTPARRAWLLVPR
jgi:structural maintenance of chromosome 4